MPVFNLVFHFTNTVADRLGTGLRVLGISLVCLAILGVCPAMGDTIFLPDLLLKKNIAEKTDPVDIADTHLRIPYRDDGVIDGNGHFTTFNRPDQLLKTPGLNCSGLVLSVSRLLFNKNYSLEAARRDRQSNSGPDSSFGEDWDFGLDLILNITDGSQRRVLMPEGTEPALDLADGMALRGFDLQDYAAWHTILPQMKPGRVYFGTISKPTRRPGYRLLHYHVVIMIPDQKGGVWLYHATRRSNVHRMNLRTSDGLRRFMGQFRGSRDEPKKILVVEALLPDSRSQKRVIAAARAAGTSTEAPSSENADQVVTRALDILDNLGIARDPLSRKKPEEAETPTTPVEGAEQPAPARPRDDSPNIAINHVSGKVFKPFPQLTTGIPRFADKEKTGLRFWFRNQDKNPKQLEVLFRGPDGDATFRGQLPPAGTDLNVVYPRDFGARSSGPLKLGRYATKVKIDGVDWCTDLFDVQTPKDAQPKIVQVAAPSTVQAGRPFTVKVTADNAGVESDYGGITVSCPDPEGLRLVSATPGKIFPRGSTVLSVTQDRIKTKAPMAERWIELWGENQSYDMTVRIQAGRPGTYPLYVRCALRSVKVEGHVILMDPPSGDTVDQQGFPVKVYMITVR